MTNPHASGSERGHALDRVATIVMLITSIVLIVSAITARTPRRVSAEDRGPSITTVSHSFAVGSAAILGKEDARLTLVVFSDFECPYCSQFAVSVLPALRSDFIDTGLVRIVFRHLPLETRHKRARRAAEAAECARRQSKFWEMHDLLFQKGAGASDEVLVSYARSVGADENQFLGCMNGQAAEVVEQDLELARSLAVSGTPTFFFGVPDNDRVTLKGRIGGLAPLEMFRRILNDWIAKSSR